ncbi:hypothetical protein EST38_g6358 [Candolleomyces aberdarensis]|uniref:Nephrocystin 3-like N-terminal domain-containing protein n=1 Tax=Candolleomyces aberdarensis TaxID=2316362 RepID=A0A4Q2DHZ6_9AGAR|nr:hypothetical protein EST38_g6358 [Candolleomyces aberdarensis]
MWVHAPAGYGKTAVAGTVADKMELEPPEDPRLDFSPLGATFFFWRTSHERNNPTRFVVTLAYQLALSIPELTTKIEDAVDQNPMILRKSLEVQLTKLIVEPFKALASIDEISNRLVIVDGLDECINSDQESRVEKKYAEDQEKVQIRILDLIYTLQSHKLPLSFLVLSRPETWIKRHFESRPLRDVTEVLDLYEVGDHLKDVEKFLRDELSRIAESLDPPSDEPGLEDAAEVEWPGEKTLQTLLSRTGGHILYAATVVRHLDDPYDDPRKRLTDILHGTAPTEKSVHPHSTPFASLYELYRQIIKSSPEGHRPVMIEVLEDLLASKSYFDPGIDQLPAAMKILDHLSGRTPGRGMKAIRGLHAVVRLTPEKGGAEEGAGDHPRTLKDYFIHSSFVEFLQTPEVSREFAVDGRKSFRRLLSGCLESLSSVTLDTKVDAQHLRFALTAWPTFWSHTAWGPSEEEECLKQNRTNYKRESPYASENGLPS